MVKNFSTILDLVTRRHILGKPNFDFQKRQKEIAKKKKNDEKKQRKLEKNAAKPAEVQDQPESADHNNDAGDGNK